LKAFAVENFRQFPAAVSRFFVSLLEGVVFLLVTASLGWLWLIAIEGVDEMGAVSTPLAAIVLGVWVAVLIIGVLLIRDARPYSASGTGRLITWLGSGILLVSVAVLLTLTGVLVL
jgi:hypothetical protein